ncbi:helix-hairpin-helix domain-containing protein [Nocardia brasiliensis]|uniref:helix-hairpin-helix domain-containing protein n=1 Tax=Nocardia brasiliensis TaxID=37326 RepID=UPI0032AF0356
MSRQQERDRTHQRLGTLTARVRAGQGTSSKPPRTRRPHVSRALAVKRWEAGGLRVLTETQSAPEPSTGASPIAEPARTDSAPSRVERCDSAVGDLIGASDVHARTGVSASADARIDASYAEPGAAMPSIVVDRADSGPGVLADGAMRPRLADAPDASLGADRARPIPQVNWALGGLAPAADVEVTSVGDDIGVAGSRRKPKEPGALPGVHRGSPGLDGNWDEEALAPAVGCEATGDDVGVVRSPGWLTEPAARRGWRDRLVPERFRGARIDPGRRGVCTLLAVGVVAMVVAGVVIFSERPLARPVPPLPAVHSTADAAAPASPPGAAAQSGTGPKPVEPSSPAGEVVVSVVGLVHRTGLVRLPTGARVADALNAAGGPRDGADTTGLNLAQRLSDGDQVLVGPSGADPAAPKLGSATISAGGRSAAPSASGSAQPPPSSGRLDLNTATEAQLDALPGVGPVTAKAIITWRTTHGRFTDITQLGDVDGIGPARLARLRELVRV